MVRYFYGKRITTTRLKDFKENGYGDAKEWEAAKRKRKALDGNKCKQCGSTDRLEVHHVVPVSRGGHRTALSNLKTLCHRCHSKHHRHMR